MVHDTLDKPGIWAGRKLKSYQGGGSHRITPVVHVVYIWSSRAIHNRNSQKRRTEKGTKVFI